MIDLGRIRLLKLSGISVFGCLVSLLVGNLGLL
jgi:hypothetical protein